MNANSTWLNFIIALAFVAFWGLQTGGLAVLIFKQWYVDNTWQTILATIIIVNSIIGAIIGYIEDLKEKEKPSYSYPYRILTNDFPNPQYFILPFLLGLGIFVTQSSKDTTPPLIEIYAYKPRDLEVVLDETQNRSIVGKATDASGIREVTVNGKLANLKTNGEFSITDRFSDPIAVKAVDKAGNIAKKVISNKAKKAKATIPADKRIALVIGNANYSQSPLNNPTNDANQISRALRNAGYEVTTQTDVDQSHFNQVIHDFAAKSQNAAIALFYFAGHGIEQNGNNYLVPVNTSVESTADVANNCFEVNKILGKMEEAQVRARIIILDACRTPLKVTSIARSFKNNRGLAEMHPKGTVIMYATASGEIANDYSGFTAALVESMQVKGAKIEDVFKQAAQRVQEKSNGVQKPFMHYSLSGDFYFSK